MKLSEIKALPLNMATYNNLKQKMFRHEVDKTDFRTYCKEYIKAIMNDQIAKNYTRALHVLKSDWDNLPEFLQEGVVKYVYLYRFIRMDENKPGLHQNQSAATRLLEFRMKNNLSRAKCCEIINLYSTIFKVRVKVSDIENYECLNQSPKIDKATAASNGFDVDLAQICGYHGKYVSPTVNAHKTDPDYSMSFAEEMAKGGRAYEMPPSVEAWFQKWENKA